MVVYILTPGFDYEGAATYPHGVYLHLSTAQKAALAHYGAVVTELDEKSQTARSVERALNHGYDWVVITEETVIEDAE